MKEIFLKDYKEPSFKIESVELVFELDEERVIVSNTMKIKKLDDTTSLELDAVELELLELSVDDEKVDYIYEDEKLKIKDIRDNFIVKIKNIIKPQDNTELEGLYKSGGIFCTQCEPEGFRKITPYLDRPDVMSIFKVTIIADMQRYPVLLSNGNKIQCHDMFNGKGGVTWFDPHPKPSYLFALVAGDLGVLSDSIITMSGKKVALNIYCDKGNESKCVHAMKSLKKAILWDEREYGREYDLDIYNIVAVDSFNMGAMENKGLNIFNSHYVLANDEVATDSDFMGIESVIAHEYFHNWTGNRITCKSWFELTLKEGLTVFRDQCFSGDMNSKTLQRIMDVKTLKQRQFSEDASPTAHPIKPKSYISMNNFYTATVYEKGAEVIRMIYVMLGKKRFRDAMDLYFESFDGKAVTTDDFLWAMSKGGGIDLEQFKRWYDQSGTPKIILQDSFRDGVYRLKIIQKLKDGIKPYHFPLKITLFEHTKPKLSELLHVKNEVSEFTFKGFRQKPKLSANQNFSAPIIVEYSDFDYGFLMRYDNDEFNRYEAATSYAVKTIDGILENGVMDDEFMSSYEYLLDLECDKLYKALLLNIPSIDVLMQGKNSVDIQKLCDARESLQENIASVFGEKLLDIYNKNHSTCKDIDMQNMGKRALKNQALRLLGTLKKRDIFDIAKEQYKSSQTMTDKIASLEVMINISYDNSKEYLKHFYKTYKNDTLIMNKYLNIIASSNIKNLLDTIKALKNDKVYDEKVPNLVRSLIGSFARNHRYFHAEDGSGYGFLSDEIIHLDSINPQMASALINSFRMVNQLEKKYKTQIKKALEKIISHKNLSANCYEMVDKIYKSV